MEKELLVQDAAAEETIPPAESANADEEAANADEEAADAKSDAEAEPDAEKEPDENDSANGKIVLQTLIAEGVKAVLAEMGLTEADIPRANSEGKPRYGVKGGANPPPRSEEDDFMRGFREV